MKKVLPGMVAAVVILVLTAFFQGGFPRVAEGLAAAVQTLLRVFPILVVAFTVSGLVSTTISSDAVSRWLGKNAGWKGPLLGSLMGALVPGGPFFFYPLMATLIISGANVGTMISFVAAKSLWNIVRVPVEIAFVGVEITAIRFMITFFIPILAGGFVNLFLPGLAGKIKEDVERLHQKG